MKQITPIITVDEVEPCLPFWTALGFEVIGTVPHDGKVGFAMLNHGDLLLMYQSTGSVEADLGASGAPADLPSEMGRSTTTLFIEVEDLDAVIEAVGGSEVIVPRRTTFYGMDEVFLRPPCGTVVGFAQRVEDNETAEHSDEGPSEPS
jgi:hypothetical protein